MVAEDENQSQKMEKPAQESGTMKTNNNEQKILNNVSSTVKNGGGDVVLNCASQQQQQQQQQRKKKGNSMKQQQQISIPSPTSKNAALSIESSQNKSKNEVIPESNIAAPQS